jgi:tetratricopeptide (TPR) repeat protein
VSTIDTFQAMLARGQDSAMLRFSLGNEYFKRGELDQAIEHLGEAVRQDPGYSAAWKIYGKALSSAGRQQDAIDAFDRGIQNAESKGDLQAAKEMRVFQRRAQAALDGGSAAS